MRLQAAVILYTAAAVAAAALAPNAALADPYTDLLDSPDYRTVRHYPLGDTAAGQVLDRVASAGGQLVGLAGPLPVVLDGPLYQAAPPATGPVGGGGIIFDGVAQHALVDGAPLGQAFNNAGGVTFVTWFRAFDTTRGALAGVMNTDGSGFQLLLGANQFPYLANAFQVTFAVFFAGGRGGFTSSALTSVDFASGEWHMLAATFKDGIARVSIDGEPQRLQTAEFAGGSGRVSPFDRPIAIAGVNDPAAPPIDSGITTRKASVVAQVSMHAVALNDAQIRALWLTGNGITGAKVYNAPAARDWFDASTTERVDVALLGDSNQLFGYGGGTVSGHIVGMTQGLRAIMPLYASTVISGAAFGGYANEVNGFSPPFPAPGTGGPLPPFAAARMLPTGQGYGSEPYVIAAGVQIGATTGFQGSIRWDSPQFPIDFRNSVDWHLTHITVANGGGAGASGVLPVGVRTQSPPYTVLAERDLSSDGSPAGLNTGDALVDAVLRIPAGPREPGVAYSLQVTDPGDDRPAVGPAALLYSRLVAPDQTVGGSVSHLWAVGGHGARLAADTLVNRTTIPQLAENLRQMVRHQTPGQERLMVMVLLGGNDVNDFRPAVSPDGTLGGFASNVLEGQKLNTLTLMTRIRDAWVGRGYATERLLFVLGPYHPSPTTGPKLRSRFVRGWRELQRDHPEFNIVVIDGLSVSSVADFYQRGWYANNNLDVAHLAREGYEGFGELAWRALQDAVYNVTPVTGVCCLGSTCAQQTATQCAALGGRFVASAAACNAPGNPRTPCCRADFDQSGALTVQDIFSFLTAWFAADPRADFASNGTTTPPGIQSVFAFLEAWFAGCG